MRIITLILCALFAVSANGQKDCLPEKDNYRLVYDGTSTLSTAEAEAIESKLSDFAASTSNQIVLALVGDLCGFAPEQMATELGDKWGVGQANDDNGIVILVKPTGGKGERHVFIAVGSGLEGAIPDGTAYQIVENEILPRFRSGDLYGGIDAAITVLMELAVGEYDSAAYAQRAGKKNWAAGLIILAIFLVVIVVALSKAKRYAATNDMSILSALMMMNMMGRSHGGSWGNFTGGSGGFGGGGGGFGGFGGGSFGGGGAGGSW